MKILTDKFQWKLLFPLCLLLCISLSSFSQCSLSPGDILFTGYNQLDDNVNGNTTDDSFSFLLLKEVSVGSEVYFTDLGWTGTAFQPAAMAPSDAILKWTSDANYPAGTEIIVYCKYKLVAKDHQGNTRGTISIAQPSYNTAQGLVTIPEQMSLAQFSGDQIFAFTGTVGNPNFIAGISINKTPGTPWESSLLATDFGSELSTRPTALATASQNLGISAIDPTDPFSNVAYAARYNREVAGTLGLPSELLAKINLASNWEIKSDGTVFSPLLPNTGIYITPFTIATQPINQTNLCPGTATSFSVSAPGACSYQWEVTDNNGTFLPITTGGGIYTNFNTATLNISNVSGLDQKKYRVRAHGSSEAVSEFATLSLVSPIVLNTDPLPAAGINIPYNEQIKVTSGGTGTHTYAITSGSLPNGLTINASTGFISGTASIAGLSNFTVTVTDNCASPNTANHAYSIIVGVLNQTITLTDYQKTYGEIFDLPLNSSAGLPITYVSGTPSVATVAGNQVTVVGVGTAVITGTQTGNANYHPATPAISNLTVSKKEVTVALNSTPVITKVYDRTNTATLAASNYTLTGILPTDIITVSSTATYNTINAGTGKIVTATAFELSGTQKDNYNVTTTNAVASGAISVKAITASLNASPVISKTYDNDLAATLVSANYGLSGVIAPDAVSISGNASYDTKDAGTGKTVTVSGLTLAGADQANYSLTANTVSTTTAEITPKPLTIALQATPVISKIYNNSEVATLAAGNYVVTGKLGTDIVTVSGTATYDDKNAGTGKTVTAQNLILDGAQKDNYSISNATASTTGEISPLSIQVMLNPVPAIQKVYDGNDVATLLPERYVLIGTLGTDEVSATGTATYDNKNAGINKTITASTLLLDGAQKDNYSLSTVSASMNGNSITPASLTLALNASPLITKAYDNTTTAPLVAANYSLNGKIVADVVTVSGTASYETNLVGTGINISVDNFVLAGADKDNYNLSTSTATTTGNITKKTITLTLNELPLISKAYDNQTSVTLAAANYDLPGVIGTDLVTVSGTANFDTKAVGTGKTITVDNFVLAGAQKDNYSLSTLSATTQGNISTAPLTLTLNSTPLISKTYDNNNTATLLPANYELSGIIGTEVVTVSGIATYDTKNAGSGKMITANNLTLAGADLANYHLNTLSTTTRGEINAKSITLALNTSPLIHKLYDGNSLASLSPANYTLTGLLGADVVTVSGTASYDSKNSGTGKTVTANNFSLAGAEKDNYQLITSTATTTGNISAAPIILVINTLPAITKVYDNTTTATLIPSNYTLYGTLGLDAVTVTGDATYDTKNAGTGKTITVNNFVLDGADKDNYSLSTSSASTTGSVTPAALTLALNASPLVTKTYDNNTVATLAPSNYTLSGVLNTDIVTVSGLANFDTNTAETGKNITANTFVLGGADKDNYSLSTNSATTTGNISKKTITLALNSLPLISKVFDNGTSTTLTAGNYTLTGILGTDELSVSGTANFDTKAVGTGKTITANDFVLAGAQKDNYSLSTTTATTSGNISTAPLTLTLNSTPAISKTYDNNTTATLLPANYTLNGIIASNVLSISGTASYDTKDAGTGKTVTASNLALTGADQANYHLVTTSATTTGEVIAKPITLAMNASPLIQKIYDGNSAASLVPSNYTLTGLLGTDIVTVAGTTSYDTKNSGTGKTVTANNFSLAGAEKDNYSLTTNTATTTGNITTAPLTLTLNPLPAITKVYDNNTTAILLPGNYTLNGKIGSDLVTATGIATYDTKNTGTGKTITANTFVLDGADKDNYSLFTSTSSTTGSVTPAALTLALNASPLITKTYDNNTEATLIPANYTLSGILGADVVTVSGQANFDTNTAENGKNITANTFVLAGAQKDNYSLSTTTATTTGNISKKSVALALNELPIISKEYDNTTSATLAAGNYNLTGILGTDELSVSGTANYDTKVVGTGKTISAGNFILAGAQKDNYSLSTTLSTTKGNISTAPLTLTLNSTPLISKTYDNNNTATLLPANYTLTGIIGTDALSVSGIATYDTKNSGSGKTVTANNFVLAGADQVNYHLNTLSATTTGEINAKPITLALNASPVINKIYDGNINASLAASNYSLTGVFTGDVVSVSGTAEYDNKNSGTGKTITANNFSLAGSEKDNYSLTTSIATTTGNIASSPLTLALNALPAISKVYDNNTTAILAPDNYSLAGIIGTDNVTVSGTSNYDNKNAGTGKTITSNTFVLAGADKDNYNLSTSTASTTGSVTPAAITLALNASPVITKTYDNNTVATLSPANYALSGVLGTDVVMVSGLANFDTNIAENGKNIIANNFVLAGAQKDNYSLSTTTATTTGNITKKSITLALNELPLISKEYDNNTSATLAAGNYSLTGILGTDELSVSGTASYNSKVVGTGKTITAHNFILAGAQKDNYSLSTISATTKGNIGQKAITASLNATPLITKVYDNTTTANLAPGNYSLSGVLGSDLVSVTGTVGYDNKNAGNGKVVTVESLVLAGADQGNYLLSNTTAATTGNITSFPISLTLNANPLISKEYDNTNTANLNPANFSLVGIKGSDQVTVSGTANYVNEDAGNGKTINAGNFVLAGTDQGNYSLINNTASTTGNISKKLLTVTANEQTKFQGTINPVFTIDYSGFVSGEGLADLATVPTASTLAQTDSEIGDYEITLNGGQATNYSFNYVNGNLKVLPGAPTSVLLATVPLYENQASGTKAGTLTATSANPSATYTYSLVSGSGDTDNAAFSIVGDQLKSNQVFDFESKSNFSIRVRATTQFGLSLDQQFNVVISDVNEVPTLAAIADQTLCYTSTSQNIPLTGISAGPEIGQTISLSFTNSNSNLIQNLSVNQTGTTGTLSYRIKNGASGTATITVTVKDNGGIENGGVDTYTRSFVITVNPLPVITIQANLGKVFGNSTEVSKGETVALTATGGNAYTWSPTSSILNTANAATIMVRPTETTTYTVNVSNANGCSESSTFTVKVLDDLEKIKTTNILSPNGDGYNDKWIIENIDVYPNNEVKIFDKSGRQIYSKRGYDNSWDGTVNGSALSEGTYYYVIDFGNNRPKFKGFITLIREN